MKGHTDMLYHVHMSPNGKHFVSAGADHTIRVWDGKTCEPVTTLSEKGAVFGVSPRGLGHRSDNCD